MDGTTAEVTAGTADIAAVMKMLPHRYPFLLVDRVVDMVSGETATGIKNVTINEPHFAGHFPENPVMPGVLIVEAMAQTAAVLVMHTLGITAEGKMVYFLTIDSARFRRPVVPGDRLMIHVKKDRRRGPVWRFQGQAVVDDVVCAEATYSAMIVDKNA